MNLGELKAYLESRHIHPDAVSFGVGLPYETERYCIVKQGNEWEVYYSERGTKGGLMRFHTEDQACRYLLGLLQKDKSVWTE